MELGLFLLHVVPGLLLIGHGAQKLFGWYGGYGPEGTGQFFEGLNLRPGRRMALAAGANEFAGGLLLALGLLMPLAAVLIGATMLTATLTAHRGKGIWNSDGGFELPLMFALIPIALAFNGAGEWSLDNAFGWAGDISGLGWGLGSIAVAVIGSLGVIALGRRRAAYASNDAQPTTT